MSTRTDDGPASLRPASAGRRGAVTVLLVAAVVLVVADAVGNAVAGVPVVYTAVFGAAMAAMVVAGLVVLRDPAHGGLGVLLLGVAAIGAFWDLAAVVPFGPFPFATVLLYWPYAGLFVHLLLRWPDERIHGVVARLLLVAAYGVMPLLSLLWQVTWSTRFYDFDASGWWWLTLAPAEDFSTAVYDAQQLALAGLLVVLAALLVVRVVRADGARRRAMLPVTVVGVVLGGTVIVAALQRFDVAAGLDLALAQNLAVLAVPTGVLIAAAIERGEGRRAVPGASPDPFAVFRARYRLGLVAITAAVLLAVAVVAIGMRGAELGTTPAPVPGPEVAAR